MKKLIPNKFQCGVYYSKRQILRFLNQEELVSNEDILSLFMGLCRLIKKSSEYTIESKYLKRINYLEKTLEKHNISYNKYREY
ncbi:MAG: hypothetical protein E7345_05185 [Clostridiales bacterium]|nr:hypothetical protein [Clostridiales bacterium]